MEDIIPEGYVRVTSVLSVYSDFSKIEPAVLKNAADRGQRVHNYCELHANGLFLPEIDQDCKGYVKSFQEWYDNSIDELVASEQRINYASWMTTGRFDMIVRIKGDKTIYSVLDIKTPASQSKTWQLQTAAYQEMIRQEFSIDITRRICLMVQKDGSKAKIVEYHDHESDTYKFMHALELYRFFNG